jgi:2-dehydropantoate 2-reductase
MSVFHSVPRAGARTFRIFQTIQSIRPTDTRQSLSLSRQYSSHKSNPKMDTPQTPDPTRIHVLGLGNIGKLFAHSLANLPHPPPLTLLFHRPSLLPAWIAADQKITITTNNTPSSSGSYDIEEISAPSPQDTPIANLILATKTTSTLTALSSISHRLNAHSTILFTQNGMGTFEEALSKVFKDAERRPEMATCIVSHGVYSLGPFSAVHAGQAYISIGPSFPLSTKPESHYLIDTILHSPVLAATSYSSKEILFLQLEKVVVNAMLNPLTVIFSCKNGELYGHAPVLKMMRMLLEEASRVILSLPEMKGDEELKRRFSTLELEKRVLDVAAKTAGNTSSMLQDVRGGRETEIEYINGWLVRKGKDRGVDCEWNERVVNMVKTGRKLAVEDVESWLENKA